MGTRCSLLLGLLAPLIAGTLGTAVGALAGFVDSWTDPPGGSATCCRRFRRCCWASWYWAPADKPAQRSAFVRIHAADGQVGLGETSPMLGGGVSLGKTGGITGPQILARAT